MTPLLSPKGENGKRSHSLLRSVLHVLGLMIVIVLALYGTVRVISTASFARLERRDVELNVRRLDQAVEDRLERLAVLAHEWAVWDDAYAFARGENPAFVDTQFTTDVVGALGVDLMAFVSPQGEIIEGRAVDPQTGEGRIFPEAVGSATRSDPGMFGLSERPRATKGSLVIDGLPFFFATQPVTTSDESARPVGSVLVGRFVDGSELRELSGATQIPVAAYLSVRDPRLSDAARQAIAASTPERAAPAIAGDEAAGYRIMRDPRGNRTFVLGIRMKRAVHAAANELLGYLLVALTGFGIIACALVVQAMTRQHRALLGRKQAETERETSEERYQRLIELMTDAVFVIGPDGSVVRANRHAHELSGRTADELTGASFIQLLSPESGDRIAHRQRIVLEFGAIESFEAEFLHATGRTIPVEVSASAMRTEEGKINGIQWIVRDITERKRSETQLMHLASRDHLTGLYNRRRFEEELRRQLEKVRRTRSSGAVVWFDLDHFKEINDTLGHHAGDQVLVGLATRLQTRLRADSLFARLGGDEFAILLPEADSTEARATATRVMSEIRDATALIEGRDVRVTASVGVVMFPEHGETAEQLLAEADLAMYRAKEEGRNRVCLFRPDEDWHADLKNRFDWTVLIERALREDRFLVFAQPILDLSDGTVHRHELLIRMEADDGSIITPDAFLPVAERTGLINEIDRWMIRQAIDLISMRASRGDAFRLDVNLSARAFADPDLLPLVEFELMRTGIEPQMLGVEITETAAVSDMARACTFLEALKALGCRIALDDFGSGFSSFYYLRHLPVDCLKIDGSFVRDLLTSEQDRHVVKAIVELSTGFGVTSTAEFVEDQETLEMVRLLGVTYAQGFHIARPMPLTIESRTITQGTALADRVKKY